LTAIAGRLASSQQRLVDLLGAPLAQQVARVLVDEAVDDELPYSQATIAALLGARRPSVNKVLKDLQHRRLIEVGYRTIEILDPPGLRAAGGRPAGQGAG
jgi:CRP-like cAMP-binding protein